MNCLIKKEINNHEQIHIPNKFFFQKSWIKIIEDTFKLKKLYIVFNQKNDSKILTLPFFRINFFYKYEIISMPYSFHIKLDEKKDTYDAKILNFL